MADRETGEMWMYGDVDNLKVTVSIAGVSVKGSLARFFLPDNTYTLTRNLVKGAVEKLSETVGLPLDRANITRMDVSTNFIMKHSAGQYFEVLGSVTNFKRSLIGRETLYYFNRGRVLTKTMLSMIKHVKPLTVGRICRKCSGIPICYVMKAAGCPVCLNN